MIIQSVYQDGSFKKLPYIARINFFNYEINEKKFNVNRRRSLFAVVGEKRKFN